VLITGPAEALTMAVTGRAAALADLDGALSVLAGAP
jgi:hypothetical protein